LDERVLVEHGPQVLGALEGGLNTVVSSYT